MEKEQQRLQRLYDRTKKIRYYHANPPEQSIEEYIESINSGKLTQYFIHTYLDYERRHGDTLGESHVLVVKSTPEGKLTVVDHTKVTEADKVEHSVIVRTPYLIYTETEARKLLLEEKVSVKDLKKVYVTNTYTVIPVPRDAVQKALDKIEDGSIDLLFYDVFDRYSGGKIKTIPPSKYKKYMLREQARVLRAYDLLKPEGASALIGIDLLTANTFGNEIFSPDNEVKRIMYDTRLDTEVDASKDYENDSRKWIWSVKNKNWTFNLLQEQGEKLYFGNYVGKDDLYVIKDMLLHFTNEGDKVLEINGSDGSVIKQACKELNREYITTTEGDET